MIKTIIKEPYRKAQVVLIENEMEELQKIVGGYIETMTLPGDLVVICNKEGKLNGMHLNCSINGEALFGTIILASVDGEEFGSLPDTLPVWLTERLGLTIRECPRCGAAYYDAPAISRKDNKTNICPLCGMDEAIQSYVAYCEQNDRGC